MAAAVVPRLRLPLAARCFGAVDDEKATENCAVAPESWQNVGRRVAAALAAVSSDSDEEWDLPEQALRPEAWRDVGGRLASVFAQAAAEAEAREDSGDGFSPSYSSRHSEDGFAWEPCEEPPTDCCLDSLFSKKGCQSPGREAATPATLPSTAPGTVVLREVALADDSDSEEESDFGDDDEGELDASGDQSRRLSFGKLSSSPFGALLGTQPPALRRPLVGDAAGVADTLHGQAEP